MSKSPQRFAQLLTQAVRRITLHDDSKIQVVQDELGYALGREAGGSSIEYWRKGHVPSRLAELEKLARELVQRGGLTDSHDLERFLVYADHPDAAGLANELLPGFQQRRAGTAAPTGGLPDQATSGLEEHPVFIAGPPIAHPSRFFGREREAKRLFNLFKRRPLQNAAIIGPRRSGKTSLLNYLKSITVTPKDQLRANQRADWLPAPAQYRWILVDFQDSRLGSRAGLLGYLLGQLNLSVPEPCGLEQFLDVLSQELQQPTIVMFDEIGVALQRYPELDDSFWEGLRALATNQVGGNLAFIMAAQEAPDQLAQHNGYGSPFFNIFGYTAFLGPLKEAEASELMASSPVPFPADDVAWILEQSGCWPILLQILCRERLLTLEENEVDSAWREDGLQQLVPFQYLLD